MPKRSRSQRGGEGMEGRVNGKDPLPPATTETPATTATPATPATPATTQTGGDLPALKPSSYGPGPFAKSQYYTISGGSRRRSRKHGKKHCSKRRKQKGGNAVLATAAVPFGLLALQRYFKSKKTFKKGRSFKRTFRRRY
jgi:hypothetical protein